MADPEISALLQALVDGQVKLAEGQERLAQQMAAQFKLVHERMDRSEKLIGERMDRFDDRMREYTEAVMRGLTAGVKRNGDLKAEIDDLKKRVTKLERKRK